MGFLCAYVPCNPEIPVLEVPTWSYNEIYKSPIVEIPNMGAVKGYYRITVTGKLFAAFDGIPYAHPPKGRYRFKVRCAFHLMKKHLLISILYTES